MGILKSFFIVFIIATLAGVLFLGYIGMIPGLASILGSDKPRDLGIQYTQADLDSAQSKLKQTTIEIGTASLENFNTSDSVSVETTINSKEYSAHVELLHPVSGSV